MATKRKKKAKPKTNKKKTKLVKSSRKKIRTSLFINPKIQDIKLSKLIGAKCIEIHTGTISRKIKSKKKYQKDFCSLGLSELYLGLLCSNYYS